MTKKQNTIYKTRHRLFFHDRKLSSSSQRNDRPDANRPHPPNHSLSIPIPITIPSMDTPGLQALRAARGGVFRLPIARLTWTEFEELTTDMRLKRFCAEPTAPNAVDADVIRDDTGGGLCLVLGNEGQGLSAEALRSCQPVAIPMPGEMESLNVGIAGGILMYLMRP